MSPLVYDHRFIFQSAHGSQIATVLQVYVQQTNRSCDTALHLPYAVVLDFHLASTQELLTRLKENLQLRGTSSTTQYHSSYIRIDSEVFKYASDDGFSQPYIFEEKALRIPELAGAKPFLSRPVSSASKSCRKLSSKMDATYRSSSLAKKSHQPQQASSQRPSAL